MCIPAIVVCRESETERDKMKKMKKIVERVRVEMMTVNDFGSWVRKVEARKAI